MRNFVKSGPGLIAALACIATFGGARAQDAPAAAKPKATYTSTVGEVTNIDAAGNKLTIKTNAGPSLDVPLDGKTHFLKISPGETDLKKATESKYEDLKVGDRVSARNRKLDDGGFAAATTVVVMTREELTKHQDKTQQEWKDKGLMGTVTLVNAATKEVTLKLIGADSKQLVVEPSDKVTVRRYSDDSIKFSDTKPSSLAEIKVGDTVRVLGAKNDDGTRVKPEEIVYGTFLRKAGTITAIDVATSTITMRDVTTKKPVLVKLNPDTVLKKIPEQMGLMLARMQQGGGRGGAAGGAAPNAAPAAGGLASGGPPSGGPPAGGMGSGRMGGGGGMGGGMGRGGLDPSRVLERAPVITLADLKIGDAIMISTSSSSDPSKVTATTLVAGMEAILAAPSSGRGGGQDPLSGSWGIDVPIPQ